MRIRRRDRPRAAAAAGRADALPHRRSRLPRAADEFLAALGARVERLAEPELAAERFLGTVGDPVVALPAAPAPGK
jgi:hypothetical protein